MRVCICDAFVRACERVILFVGACVYQRPHLSNVRMCAVRSCACVRSCTIVWAHAILLLLAHALATQLTLLWMRRGRGDWARYVCVWGCVCALRKKTWVSVIVIVIGVCGIRGGAIIYEAYLCVRACA